MVKPSDVAGFLSPPNSYCMIQSNIHPDVPSEGLFSFI